MISDVKTWLEELGRVIDSKDGEKFASYLTENGLFRFGNAEPVSGRKAIADYVNYFFTMHNGSSHKVVDFWKGDNSIVWQGEVVYTRIDNKKVTVNFTNIFYMNGDLIEEYLIYIDNSPLFAS